MSTVADLDAIHAVHAAIRASGGRLTVPTRVVISILASSDEHLTADDVIAAVEARIPGVSPSTIYRVVQRLGELGLVEHVHSGIGPAFYHLRERGHAHLVCNRCGVVVDVPDAAFSSVCSFVEDGLGFRLDLHHSALNGVCAQCAETAPDTFEHHRH